MSNNNKIVLEYKQVSKIYQLGTSIIKAVDNVSFSIRQGEFIAIVGPSGSGKSTLLHIGAGIDRPSKGVVILNQQNIENMSDNKMAYIRNQNIGFIFQSFNLLPILTVKENIEYPCELYKESLKNKKNVDELLELVGLADQKNKRPYMLSGGQRQRVAIARALINNPAIVFADEPTANLDHKTGIAIMDLLQKINNERGTTFIFSTHDSKIMERAKRLIYIEDGKINDTI